MARLFLIQATIDLRALKERVEEALIHCFEPPFSISSKTFIQESLQILTDE